MKIKVLFFSVLKDITGAEELALTVPQGATVQDLLGLLFDRWPGLAAWEGSLLVAVNQSYSRRNDALSEGAEVAVMPPVQGG
ncbi:MAG: MoaD/ThiS family protein [Verrucomicrobium sp.]|nr:MoaD/ThiS family protein [Verrucomicrobium sp.]